MRGDILVIRNKGWLFSRVREVIDSEYDHVAIYVTNKLIVEATPHKGVQISKAEKYTGAEYKLLRLKDYQYIDKMIEFHLLKVGTGYDFLNLIGLYIAAVFKLKKPIGWLDIHKAYLCCELLADAGESAGLFFDKDVVVDLITPANIVASREVVEVE